jgi:hypothetical protein
MPDEPQQISILDARLAEIDKRLRTIQTGLVTEPAAAATAPVEAEVPEVSEVTEVPPEKPAPALPPRVEVPEPGAPTAGLHAVPPPVADESLAEAVDELRSLAATHESLLVSMRGLLADYERALTEARTVPAAAPPAGYVRSLSVTAGPFASTEAVRGFERALSALPGVQAVELRGYEGGDRAIVDVHLSGATS